MIDQLSSSDIANEVSMMRSAFKGTVLVVEGVSDSRLYGKFIDRENVRIIIAHSKNNVMQSVNLLHDKRKDNAVLGIIDRDMDALLGRKRSPPLFPTDKRDLESTILASPAFDAVMAEYGDNDKVRNFEKRHGPIRDCLVRAASPVGLLMFISYRKGMNLSFKDLDFTFFVNPHALTTDLSKLVAHVYSVSMGQRYQRGAVVDMLMDLIKDFGDSWDVTRGHDAVTVLKLALRTSLGAYNSKGLTDGELGGALRLAYSRGAFESTNLYRATWDWCRENGLKLWS